MAALKHIVMWNVVGDDANERAASIEAIWRVFEGLIGRIAGLIALEIGADVSRAAMPATSFSTAFSRARRALLITRRILLIWPPRRSWRTFERRGTRSTMSSDSVPVTATRTERQRAAR